MKIDSFVFYRSFFDAISDLEKQEKIAVYEAIFALVFEKKEPKLTGISATLMKLIRPNIEASIANRTNGRKGGRPSKKRGDIEKEKGGLLKKNNPAFQKTETNGYVNEDDNGDDFAINSFDGETAEVSIIKEWQKELSIMQFNETEKMAIKELTEKGCIAEDAKNARLENPKYFGKIAGDHTRRLIVTQKDLRLARPKGNGLQFPF